MLIKLFLSFAYIGTFTFGGGYAMLPMFHRVLVEKHRWLEKDEVTEFFSVGQCLPGAIAPNAAVIVGYKQRGIIGSIAAVLGVTLPSVVLILLIASLLDNVAGHPIIQRAFIGLRICVSVLILNTVFKLWKNSVVDKSAILIFAAVFLLSVFTNLPVAVLVVAAGLCGIAITNLRRSNAFNGGAK
ncbi:MAG: chromate transporter [Oscillospiraceae bacterium]|nr:chromate transporter [Oscillospiraceae bacterium]